MKLKGVYILFLTLCMVVLPACQQQNSSKGLVFSDFEKDTDLDMFHWRCFTLFSISDLHASHGRHSLKFEMYPSEYPGFAPRLKHHDWKKYNAFCFDVYNPSDRPVEIVLRIDDKKEALEYSDRFNRRFNIPPGANSIKIPLTELKTSNVHRPMNLEFIYRFMVFMVHPDKKHILYFDYFRLD